MEGRHGSLVAMWGNGFGGIWLKIDMCGRLAFIRRSW